MSGVATTFVIENSVPNSEFVTHGRDNLPILHPIDTPNTTHQIHHEIARLVETMSIGSSIVPRVVLVMEGTMEIAIATAAIRVTVMLSWWQLSIDYVNNISVLIERVEECSTGV